MEERERESYPSDLTDKQWEEIAPLYADGRSFSRKISLGNEKKFSFVPHCKLLVSDRSAETSPLFIKIDKYFFTVPVVTQMPLAMSSGEIMPVD